MTMQQGQSKRRLGNFISAKGISMVQIEYNFEISTILTITLHVIFSMI